MAHFYVYSDLGTDGVTVEAPADYEIRLAAFLRTRTKPLSVGDVAKAIGGKQMLGTAKPIDNRKASGTVRVAKMALTIQRGEEQTYLKVHDDRKPGINAVGDFRTRPAPFLMDGTCRG